MSYKQNRNVKSKAFGEVRQIFCNLPSTDFFFVFIHSPLYLFFARYQFLIYIFNLQWLFFTQFYLKLPIDCHIIDIAFYTERVYAMISSERIAASTRCRRFIRFQLPFDIRAHVNDDTARQQQQQQHSHASAREWRAQETRSAFAVCVDYSILYENTKLWRSMFLFLPEKHTKNCLSTHYSQHLHIRGFYIRTIIL